MSFIMGSTFYILLGVFILGFVCTFKPEDEPDNFGLLKSLLVLVAVISLLYAVVRLV